MAVWRDRSPREWRELVNREVCVTTRDRQRLSGRLFTVDPVSASIVLVCFPERARPLVQLVLGHAVCDVQILSEGTEETERRMHSLLLPQHTHTLSPEELRVRKECVRAWLEQNRVPVCEQGETLCVARVLTIGAPYSPGDCSCANQIILQRVQRLLERCPDTHTPAEAESGTHTNAKAESGTQPESETHTLSETL